MSGAQMALAANALTAVLAAVSPLAAGTANGEGVIGSNATGILSFSTTGSLSYSSTPSEVGSGPAQWLTQVGAGNGTGFWIRATPTLGAFSSNPAVTWVQMNVGCVLTRAGIANQSCTFTLEIATDAAGTNIVSTSVGWVVRCTHV